jgi:adenylate cyclase
LFRAAIHEGPVVLGELGAGRKEIALIGDAMNVAARLLEAARDTGAFAIISGPLYDRLAAPPPGLVGERLGPLTPRGKSASLEIVSLRET